MKMDKLARNVINIMGSDGRVWITSLPNTVRILMDCWKLSNLLPVTNMSFNYVAKAICNHNQSVILKIGFDKKVIAAEKHALIYFDGNASIRIIDYHEEYNALLLEQAIPGTSLKALYPAKDKFVIDCYGDTVQKLHHKPLVNKHGFRHINDWLKILDEFKSDQLSRHLLERAIYLKNMLLNSLEKEVVLHGDLHHDNVLKNENSWLTIDPKGIIGETAFEVAAFDFIHDSEITDTLEVRELFLSRIKAVAAKSNVNAERLKNWVFVRLILSAVWYIEDNGDPGLVIRLADILNGT